MRGDATVGTPRSFELTMRDGATSVLAFRKRRCSRIVEFFSSVWAESAARALWSWLVLDSASYDCSITT
jgi:hypothetical protein